MYLHTDHLGSTTLVTDQDGAEVGRAAYDPYGNLIDNTIPLAVTDRLFTGQIWEPSLGLYNYRARFYDPLTGSFTQPDSIVPNAMDPRAWNRFGYVYGNPANFTDPSGHCIEDACILETTLLVGLIGGLINVGVNWGAAYQRGESYNIWDYGTDLGIGTVYGMAYYQVGLATGLGFFRYPVMGGLSVLESATTAGLKGRTFTTNDALFAFATGTGFPLILGESMNLATRRGVGGVRQVYKRSMEASQRSIHAMRQANVEDAARIAQYMQEFPNSRMIRSMGRYHMSRYIEWNKALFHLPLTRLPQTVAAIETAGTLTSAAMADNEYLGLFTTPTWISKPTVLIPR